LAAFLTRKMSMWYNILALEKFCKTIGLESEEVNLICNCQNFGLVNDTHKPAILTFAENDMYLEQALKNPSVQVILCWDQISVIGLKNVICVPNPRFVFWSLVEYVGRHKEWLVRSIIDKSVIIKPSAVVSEVGCVIESGTVIEEAAIILQGTKICKNCVIGSGSIIGSDGLEVKQTVFGRVRITHDAGVVIDDNVTLGAGCTVNKGLLGQDTCIGNNTKIDSGVHIAHSCKIGSKNTIAANATFGGAVVTGNDVFIGLNATIVNAVTIGNQSFIGAGTVVVRSIESGMKVLPYPTKVIPI
jgi:acetyltransferase-like isoleucine patch superfamily enzyme